MRSLRAWMRERFPARNAVFFAVFYVTALLIGRADGNGDGPIVLSFRDAAGFIALWCFFLMLRVFDEHKDFEADAIAHPHRVLHARDDAGTPQMPLALGAEVVVAADWKMRLFRESARVCVLVAEATFLGNHVQIDALDAT